MFNRSSKTKSTLPDKNAVSSKEWLPVKDIQNGIVILKNGEYLKIFEVLPINFKLRSKIEKRSIILNYREFLKACHYPMQISIQCKKADIEPHIKRMEGYLKKESNENVKRMGKGYIGLVRTLGKKGAASRRFFLVVPYVQPAGIKTVDFADVDKQLSEKKSNIQDYLKPCGNGVVDTADSGDTEYILNVLYSCINKRTCDIQRFACKLLALTGIYTDFERESDV
jgi:hypothetical protein